MTPTELAALYRGYLECLNQQDWPRLGTFVDDQVMHNGRALGLGGYQAMLEQDFATIPDLHFVPELLVAEPPQIAARLAFVCSPNGRFLGLETHGARLRFCENVFYRFEGGKIAQVWSVIDKAAVEAQLAQG